MQPAISSTFPLLLKKLLQVSVVDTFHFQKLLVFIIWFCINVAHHYLTNMCKKPKVRLYFDSVNADIEHQNFTLIQV